MKLPTLNAKSVLVIVDMQTGFATARKAKTVANCLELIQHFKAHQLPIVLLRYGRNELYSYGAILPQIAKATRNYPLTKKITKFSDSGAAEVMAHFHKGHHFLIGGVNTEVCVAETSYGLATMGHSVSVVAAACNSNLKAILWDKIFPKSIDKKPVRLEVLT